jgi:hypothetical protein
MVARWAVSSPEHALIAAGAAVVLFLLARSSSAPEQAVRTGSVASTLVAAGALLTGWWFLAHPQKPAAAPAPVTRTVYVHQTVTKVVQAAGHSGLPAWAIVVIAVVAFGSLCALRYARSSS